MGWGFLGDAVETIGDGFQAVGNAFVGTGKALTGDFEGARESFGDAGENLQEMGRDGLDAARGIGEFALAPGLYVAKEAAGLLDGMWDALSGLRDRVSGWLDGLLNPLGWIFDKVKDLFSSIWDTAKDFIDQAKLILRGINAPETLQQTAQKWRDGPVQSVGALIPTVSQRSELANANWTDDAGRAYAQRVPAQVKAVAETQAVCTKTADSLDEAAKALLTYYTDCGGLVGRVYAATHGSPGSLFSLGGLSSILFGGLGSIIDLVRGLAAFAQEMARIQEQMAQAVTSSDAFAGGQWPVAAGG